MEKVYKSFIRDITLGITFILIILAVFVAFNNPQWVTMLFIPILLCVCFVFFYSFEIVIDERGIRSESFKGKTIFIPWDEVSELAFLVAIKGYIYRIKGKNDTIYFNALIRKRKELVNEIVKRAKLRKSDKYRFGTFAFWSR